MALRECVVKERGAWKSIGFESFSLKDNFDGLVCVKQLDDYEIIGGKLQSTSRKNKKVKGKLKVGDDEPPEKKRKIKKDNKIKEKKPIHKKHLGKKGKGKLPASDKHSEKKHENDLLLATENKVTDMSGWHHLFVPNVILMALAEQGFAKPTPIQSLVLNPAIMFKKDIIGAAETGSGKTLAFGIPILNHILNDKEVEACEKRNEEEVKRPLRALILTPTRELAFQVKQHLQIAAKHTDIKIVGIVGGMSQQKQLRLLKGCPDIVVGTPGRLWDLKEMNEPHLSTMKDVKYLVIDEADRMVEKGHFEELTIILEHLNVLTENRKKRQTFVFSATLTTVHHGPQRLMKKKFQLDTETKLNALMSQLGVKKDAEVFDLTSKMCTAENLAEARINCTVEEKDIYLYYFLVRYPGRSLIFCNSKDCVRRLVNLFTLLQCNPLSLHADLYQKQRLKNLERFSANKKAVLLASDVAARGLDIPNVQHVIHYQVPRTMENYVHRSGRTARANKEGLTVMLVTPEDAKNYRKIMYNLGREKDLQQFPVEMEILAQIRKRVNLARRIDAEDHWFSRKKQHNDWFRRMADELDLELDENEIIHDLGDSSEQAKRKKRIKQMRLNLNTMLKKPVKLKVVSEKYPTCLGHLQAPEKLNKSVYALNDLKNQQKGYTIKKLGLKQKKKKKNRRKGRRK